MPHNYKLCIQYDGTNYHGWQVQPNGTTIQELIQNAIKTLLKEDVVVIGSGRTDAGVHASGQTAHFHFHSLIDLYRFQGSLNALLPKDIRIQSVCEAPMSFHAQHSAIAKTYHYHIHLDRYQDPFNRLYRWHIREQFDVEKFQQAAKHFIGTHDFTSFANQAHSGSASVDPVRTMQRMDVIAQAGGLRIELEATGFLYKMVRNIVGTMHEIAINKRSCDSIPAIFAAKDRRCAGQAAPPQGLFLVHVSYDEATCTL